MYLKLILIVFLQLISNIDSINLLSTRLILPSTSQPLITTPRPAYTKCQKTGYENWITFDNNTCYLISYSRRSWHDANDDCHSKNSELLSIHDLETNNKFVNMFLQTYKSFTTYSISYFLWIGMNSLSKRGFYKWSDGSATQFTRYSSLTVSGAPQSNDIYLQGRCILLKVGNSFVTTPISRMNGFWFRDDCNNFNGYICQKSLITPTALPTTPTPPGNCPADWIQYADQKCIKIIEDSLMTFAQAKAKCTDANGELLSIHSSEEQNFVTSLIADRPMPFIGIKQNLNTYSWSWDDQSKVTYSNWAAQSFYIVVGQAYCAIMITNDVQAGKWFKTPCDTNHTVICERPKDSNIATPPPKAFPSCSTPGFESFKQYRKSCYLLVDDPNSYLSFNDAEKSCQSKNGAHLVSIVNPFEYSFLKYYITQFGKSDQYWIGFYATGFSDSNVSQVFKWTDNWPNYFTQWDDNEPLFAGQTDEECVYQSKGNATWRTTDCSANKAYICKTTSDQIPQTNTEDTGICPKVNSTDIKQQWVDLDKRSKYCYWFSADLNLNYGQGLMTWADASFHCRMRNGTLASIHSNHELSLMKSRINNNKYNTWIGLFKTQNGDYMWEDGSAVDFTNWDDNQLVDYRVVPATEDSGDMCVETKTLDMKWRQTQCTGYVARNLYICQTKKVPKLSPISSSSTSLAGMSGGSKAGIAIGVLLVVAVVIGGIVLVKKNKLSVSALPSFENSLYSSRRGHNPRQNGSHDITGAGNDNPFNKAKPIP